MDYDPLPILNTNKENNNNIGTRLLTVTLKGKEAH